MASPHPPPGHEEYETMPWGMLADELDKGRHRTLALTVVAVVAVGVLAFLVVRSFRQTPGTVVEVPTGTAVTAPAAAPPSPVIPASPAATATSTTAPAAPALYTEADLRAAVPDLDMRLAAVRAEWFVSEWFSSGAVDRGLATDGLTARTIPDGSYSWVEWARTTTIEAHGDGRYDVTVVFRTLAGNGRRPVAPTAARAVVVPVVVDDRGGSAVVDLPAPAELPPVAEVTVAEPPGPVPDDVAAAALERAAGVGGTASVVGGSPLDGGWRVVVTVTDRSGAAFPLAVVVPG